jgi:hypothetical protein
MCCCPPKANLQGIKQGCLDLREIKKRQTLTSWCDRFRRAERVPRSGTCVHLLVHACMHAGAGSSPHSLLSCSRRTPWTLWVRLMIRLATGNQRNHHHHCMLGRDRTSQDRPGQQSRERGTCSYSPPYLVDRIWCIDGCRPVVV